MNAQGEPKLRKRRLPLAWIAASALLVVAILACVTMYFLFFHSKPTFPPDIHNAAKFTLYYPTSLPKGFEVDRESITIKDQVVIFTIRRSEEKIFVSEQAKPNIDFDQFHLKKLNGSVDKLTPIGKATIGLVAKKTYAISIVTPGTWIFSNTTAKLSDVELDQIALSFEASK